MDKIDSNGFMRKERLLKKMSNFMHCWVLISIQTQRKDLDMFAILVYLANVKNKQAVGSESSSS